MLFKAVLYFRLRDIFKLNVWHFYNYREKEKNKARSSALKTLQIASIWKKTNINIDNRAFMKLPTRFLVIFCSVLDGSFHFDFIWNLKFWWWFEKCIKNRRSEIDKNIISRLIFCHLPLQNFKFITKPNPLIAKISRYASNKSLIT